MENEDCSRKIFAEMRYSEEYTDVHSDIVALMNIYFTDIMSGLQGDSWVWITDGNEKVAIDTFSSMKHQVKSCSAGQHVQKVIDALRVKYDVHVFDSPLEEWG